jgi:hypothetical protein
MKTWHVYANPKARLIGIAASDPPVTGGVVFDTFEHDGGTHADRLRIADERNGPLRLQCFERGVWRTTPETFPLTDAGYDEAIMSLYARNSPSTQGQMRLVTGRGTVVPHAS